MKEYNWQPAASIETLQNRAAIFSQIRQFFAERNVLEVDVSVLGETGVTDLHIDCIQAQVNDQIRYLQSSPEYFLKRLLAADIGDIYYLGKAFRDGESGQRHNTEFTLLEWYRTGWDEQQLMGELAELVQSLSTEKLEVQHFSYREIFQQTTSLDPHRVELTELQQRTSEIAGRDFSAEGRSECLDLIFSLIVEPQLPQGLVFVDQYPACQAALAKLGKDDQGLTIARRFETFLNGLELANGYFELTDSEEQRTRFQADQLLRQAVGKSMMDMDERLLAAMESGLPECAGVALGVDRLLMKLLEIDSIKHVIAFPST